MARRSLFSQRGARASRACLVALVAVLFVVPALMPTAAAPLPCTTDPDTGLPVPATVPGVCVVESNHLMRLVQVTDNGLLIVSPKSDPAVALQDGGDGTRSLRLHDERALLIYCPTSGLERGLARPDPACLKDFPSLVTGPSAYMGIGTVQVRATTLQAGDGSCPASIHVLGDMLDSGGARFDLHSSLVLGTAAGGKAPADGCATTYAQTSLVKAPSQPDTVAAPYARSRSAQAAALLMQLDDKDRKLVEQLITMNDADYASLAGQTRTQTLAICDVIGGDVTNLCLKDRIDQMRSVVDATKDKVDLIRNDTAALHDKIAGAPDHIVESVQGIAPQDLLDLVHRVGTGVRGFLDTVDYLRADFDTWNDCDGGAVRASASAESCTAFKSDLDRVLTDVEGLIAFMKSTSCLDRPNSEQTAVHLTFVRDLLDRTPPVALLALNKMLDAAAPEPPAGSNSEIGGWRTMFGSLLTVVNDPDVNLAGQISDACHQPISLAGDPPACAILRPPLVGFALDHVNQQLRAIDLITKVLDSFDTKDDQSLTLAGVVVGGAGAGANVINPIKISTLLLKLASSEAKGVVGDLIGKRKSCLATDATIEGDLRGCSPRLSYVLAVPAGPFEIPLRRPTYEQAIQHVERDVAAVGVCKAAGGCADSDALTAQADLGQARRNPSSSAGFAYLCDAYCELLGGAKCNNAGGKVGPENCRNGVDDNGNGLIDCADPFCASKPMCRP